MKKGIGLSFDIGNWPGVQEATGAGWFLNWSFAQHRKEEAGDAYVPLLAYDYSLERLAAAAAFAAAWPGSWWLIGNEPNDIYQDNLLPWQAAQAYSWAAKAILEADPTARVLIGGVLNDVGFMETLVGHIPDATKALFKGLHWHRYGWGPDAVNAGQFKADVDAMVLATKGWGAAWDWRAWLTEFGVMGYGTSGIPVEDIVAFIEDVLPWMEGRAYLQRFAWFCWKKHESQAFPVAQLCWPVLGAAYKEAA